MTDTDERTEYIEGLRALATLLEATPELPMPNTREIEWTAPHAKSDDTMRAYIANVARLIPGRLDKNDPTVDDYTSNYFELSGNIGGLPVRIWARRERVCTRVVTGTVEVTKQVPAPDAPMIEVKDYVDTYEWRCDPILTAVSS